MAHHWLFVDFVVPMAELWQKHAQTSVDPSESRVPKAGGCGHEFCWLCLGEWASHGTSTGGLLGSRKLLA